MKIHSEAVGFTKLLKLIKPGRMPALALFALLPHCALAEPSCGDFLEAAGRKPPALEFVGCQPGHDAQVRALIATYRVRGALAAGVEDALVRDTQMARLRFACCGWEPDMADRSRLGSLPGPDQLPYQVTMASEETLVNQRSAWYAIPWFHVTLTLPLEEP
ncbi:MAG: DUF4952 domain-containing protein [Pseudomonadota bacterium]